MKKLTLHFQNKKSVMLHTYLPLMATSLQRSLSSVPKVAVVRGFTL